VIPAAKPAAVRFYLDADILGLAKVLVTLRPAVECAVDVGEVGGACLAVDPASRAPPAGLVPLQLEPALAVLAAAPYREGAGHPARAGVE
jgi:hypothetical protein